MLIIKYLNFSIYKKVIQNTNQQLTKVAQNKLLAKKYGYSFIGSTHK